MVGKLLSAGTLGLLAATALPAVAADQAVSFGTALVYSPSAVHVVAGERVTFTPDPGNDFATNGGSTHHPLDFVDPSIPDQTSGDDAVSRTFAQPGTYTFFCRNHGTAGGSGMSGSVVVAPPPSGPPAPPPPTTPAPPPTSTAPTGSAPPPTQQSSSTPAGSGAATDTTAPTVALQPVALRGLRHRRAVVRFISSEGGRASATLTARGAILARGTKTVQASGLHTLSLRTTKAGRRLVRRTTRVQARLRFALRDTAGNVGRVDRTVTVRA
jgi:plastocyanin